MKIAYKDGIIVLADVDRFAYDRLRKIGFKYKKANQTMSAIATIELLDSLSRLIKLPPLFQNLHKKLKATQSAVDAERVNPEPTPMANYPIKVKMYKHQLRAANMAMLTFEATEDIKDGSM